MLKLYRPQAEMLLLLAAATRAQARLSLSDLLTLARDLSTSASPLTSSQRNTLAVARKGVKPSPPDEHWLDATLKTLFAGLAEDQVGGGESDLLDQIVRAIQLPYARNVISGESMRRLRSAILLPSEQAGLVSRLRQREMACSNCGIALHDRESVTLLAGVDGSLTTIACHRCTPPTSVPCVSCEQVAALSTKAMNAMSRMQCPACQEAKTAKTPPVQPEADPEPEVAPAPPLWGGRRTISIPATQGNRAGTIGTFFTGEPIRADQATVAQAFGQSILGRQWDGPEIELIPLDPPNERTRQ